MGSSVQLERGSTDKEAAINPSLKRLVDSLKWNTNSIRLKRESFDRSRIYSFPNQTLYRVLFDKYSLVHVFIY